MGVKWVALPPPYNDEDKVYLDYPLPGTYKFAVGKGSAYKTLQVVGGAPAEDADVDMGWAQIHISAKGRDLTMSFAGGKEAIESRWAMERELDEYDREAYAEVPSAEIRERIPKGASQSLQRLGKMELPEYGAGRVRVYDVNGAYVRSVISKKYPEAVNFTQGSHWLVADYIPENEIWIDRAIQGQDHDATIVHELNEVPAMYKGMPYEEAHEEVANPAELEVRHDTSKMPEIIEETREQYDNIEGLAEDKVYVPAYYRNKKGASKQQKLADKQGLTDRYYLGRKLRPAKLEVNI